MVLGWTASVGLCWALAAGRVPTARWLEAWLSATPRAAMAAPAPARVPQMMPRRSPAVASPAALAPPTVRASEPPPAVTALALLAPADLALDDAEPSTPSDPSDRATPRVDSAAAAPALLSPEATARATAPAVPLPRVEPAPTAAEEPVVSASAGVSCEAAAAAADDEIVIGGPSGPADLPASAFARVLNDGRWLAGCGASAHTTIDVCVAVREGRVVGATVTTRPANSGVARCIAQAARRLRFQSSPRLDVARTRFAGER